jgi:signal transduction histidine kinase
MATTYAERGSRRSGASGLPTGEEADLPIAALLEAQKEIIDTMARGTGLRETLSQITSLVERLAPPALCSILLLDPDGVHLRAGAAPSLPQRYNDIVDGLEIGPSVGSCGTAAYRREPVIVRDIATDPLWEIPREFTLSCGLRACWSLPIMNDGGVVLGTIAMYYREPRAPTGHDWGLLEPASHLVRLALAQNRKQEELSEAQSELMTTARQAGMAEIANNVLHNIGNVLNSVNISAGLVNSKMRDSKAQGLAKAVQMMNLHAADLGDFLTRDEKGKLLPGYLTKLVAALALEQKSVVEELEALTKCIDHIKDIVAIQQTYSGTASIVEAVQVKDLLEDALRMNIDSMARNQVTVVKEFADLPLLLLDKSRVLQILVNLMRNAKQAMDGAIGRAHRMTLHANIAEHADGRRLRIEVEDDGEGIPKENLAQLFVHGFTTRKNGHGFGLHSCALAAKEMGGTLTAHSDGPEKGAAFTLELPIRPVAKLQ